MSFTVTLGEVLDSNDGMRWLSEQKLPAKDAYSVLKLQRKLDGEIKDFIDLRNLKIKEFSGSGVDEDGRNAAFEKYILELLSSPVTINVNKVAWEAIGQLGISSATLNGISPFVEFPEDME